MCGICGIYGMEDKSLLKRMTSTMVHRGPDDHGYFLDKNIMIGQRRLSIIDLHTGKQPIYNEDKSIVVLFNGEIYNYIELRAELEKKGHRFATQGDTEVIVHAYEEYGEACLKKLNGMFAIALWDSNKKRLLLARDRVGIKPLYYTHTDGLLIFGSEIKSILECKKVKREVSHTAFHHFVNLRYNPGEDTMFKGIYKLLPGYYMTIDKSGITKKKFWDLTITEKDAPEHHYLRLVDKHLERAVELQMRSDVPVGLLLSSGIDSTTLAAYASRHSDKLKTFTMGFGEADDECAPAQAIANHLGCDHTNLIIEGDFLKDFKKLIWHMDQPKRNLYTYYIYEKMRDHVKVILSGLGGDELFAGYTFRYKYMMDGRRYRGSVGGKGIIKRVLQGVVNTAINQYTQRVSRKGSLIKTHYLDKLHLLHGANDDAKTYYFVTTADSGFTRSQLKSQVYGDNLKMDIGRHGNPFTPIFEDEKQPLLSSTLRAEFKEKLPNDFLSVDDGMSMAASVESRVPFFDNNLIDLAFTIPNKYKFDGVLGKLLLRKNLKKLLPSRLMSQKKQGFASNTYSIYNKELKNLAHEHVQGGNAVKLGLINNKFIQKVLNSRSKNTNVRYYNLMWNLYAFELWHDLYLS